MGVKLAAASGGSIELVPTNTASSFTVTVPAKTGTMAIDGPAFSAYMSSSPSWATGVFTKAAINTEEFDTNSNFDSTTNYRFTPTVAGYYQVNGAISFGNTVATGAGIISLYKNGAEFKKGGSGSLNAANFTIQILSTILYLNGSTDYVELYGVQTSAGALTQNGGATLTYFSASMVRGA
jgi:hypothetical protein